MHIIRYAITAAYMCARDRMTTPFVTAIHITLVDCNQLPHVDIYIYTVAQDLSILCDPKEMATGKTSGSDDKPKAAEAPAKSAIPTRKPRNES